MKSLLTAVVIASFGILVLEIFGTQSLCLGKKPPLGDNSTCSKRASLGCALKCTFCFPKNMSSSCLTKNGTCHCIEKPPATTTTAATTTLPSSPTTDIGVTSPSTNPPPTTELPTTNPPPTTELPTTNPPPTTPGIHVTTLLPPAEPEIKVG